MLFKEKIQIENKSEIKYGHTKIEATQTLMEIQQILKDYNCERVLTDSQGDSVRLGFQYRGSRYLIQIPNVYLKGDFKPKIGPRVVKHYLETLLSWTEAGITTMERALLPARLVRVSGKSVPISEIAEQADDGELVENIAGQRLTGEGKNYIDISEEK